MRATTFPGISLGTQRRSRQHFSHPNDREIVEPNEAVETLFAHTLPAHPGNSQIGTGALPQRRDQTAAQRVARGLARDDENERRLSGGHVCW